MQLAEYEESICNCGCGLPRDVAFKKQGFVVHEVVCYAGKAVKTYEAEMRKKHKDDESWFDGRHFIAVPASKEADPDN